MSDHAEIAAQIAALRLTLAGNLLPLMRQVAEEQLAALELIQARWLEEDRQKGRQP